MKQQSMEAWLSRKTAQAGPELLEPVWSLARWQRSTACHEARVQWRGSVSRKRDSCKQMENDWELQMLENGKNRKKRKFQKNRKFPNIEMLFWEAANWKWNLLD